jgi:hypothetical protein
LLGINLSFTSSHHTDTILNTKHSSQLQLLKLKATSGQKFGDKKTLKITYNAYMKSTISSGYPVWFPTLDPGSTAITRLQRNQNAAMRTITGAHKNSDEGHLLAETQLLPVREHLDLVCKQFLASASRKNHPSHATFNLPSGSRPGRSSGIVHTLQSMFGHVVQPLLNDEGVFP